MLIGRPSGLSYRTRPTESVPERGTPFENGPRVLSVAAADVGALFDQSDIARVRGSRKVTGRPVVAACDPSHQ